MNRRVIASVLSLSVLAGGAWWWHARTPRWNIVLITLDTTRADHLGCYGDESAATANLDRLASESVVFDRAYTVVPITLPAHATLLTGLLPPEHGLRINGTNRLPESALTLAESLRAKGYRTGAFVSSLVLDSQFGLDRGFELYDDNLAGDRGEMRAERPAVETISAAVSWLNEAAGDRLFCWVHLYDPHDPYIAHRDEFGDRFVDAPYRGEIAYMDQQIGRLLSALSELEITEQTIIVVAGDHGEGLGEHGERTHGYMTYNSTLHVPLMIRHPEFETALRVADPVSLVDVHPTLADALHVASPADGAGRSLLPYARGQQLELRACYGETEAPYLEGGWSPVRAWVTDRWKYIATTIPELYDLRADPQETANVIDAHPDELTLLIQDLTDFEGTLEAQVAAAVANDEEQLKALRGLGYAGGQPPARQSAGPLADIKLMLPYAEQVHETMHLVDEGDAPAAQRILEEVVAAAPEYPKAWGTLGICLAVQGQHADAERHFRRALELDSNQNFARIGLGRALYETGRLEECVEQLLAAVEVEPTAVDGQFYLGEACRRLERWDEARAALAATIELQPDFSEGLRAMAELERQSGNLDRSADLYQRVLAIDPQSIDAAFHCARVLSELDRDGEAIETLNLLLRTAPRHVDGLCELSELLATSDNLALRDPAQAIRLAESACRITDRASIRPLRVLAVAHAAAGRFPQAIEAAETALGLSRGSDDSPATAAIEEELERYRTHAAGGADN